MSDLRIRILGPIEAERGGRALPITKPRLRELLGILVAAHGRVVSTNALIDDLWDGDPPPGAVGAVRTFVGELRRALEPDRAAGAPPSELVTVVDGYAFRVPERAVDAWSVGHAPSAASAQPPDRADDLLTEALLEWRGSAFEEFADRAWAAPARANIASLRTRMVEQLAEARIARGRPDTAVPLLDGFLVEQPWNEEAWRLLALALHRDGRTTQAFRVLSEARERLERAFGIDASSAVETLFHRLSIQDPSLDADPALRSTADALARSSTRAQLESSGPVLTSIAVSGDIAVARVQRLSAIDAAEELGDPLLVAQVTGSFEAPGIWTRSDDEEHAARIVAAAERALDRLPPDAPDRVRARLLATIAMESRGTADRREEAQEAESLSLIVEDPLLQCLAQSSLAMQTFWRTGLAVERSDLGSDITHAGAQSAGITWEITGLFIQLQASCALDDIAQARRHADAIDALAGLHERTLASVFTGWFRWTFEGAATRPPPTGRMPGFEEGIEALDDVTRALRSGRALPPVDPGSYAPWVQPLLLAHSGRRQEALSALREAPDPPKGLLLEVLWCLLAEAAIDLDDAEAARRCVQALAPARGERAAGSAVIDLGPIAAVLDRLTPVAGSAGADAATNLTPPSVPVARGSGG
ncbi:AfsR/SARP family transcriptional regulator [Labedella endophytica]|uniref:AfsR family transcriptional regulator n=1 Tax=Labedella endophytica TaxID=1523160 RepID=A0A433JPT5_9MICO|nr:BTAD domain-containing putative transcriptional regulator [Labedella endophytica]RUQ98131.1 AfsR family transcriptional regulator [Labedella endophytica]